MPAVESPPSTISFASFRYRSATAGELNTSSAVKYGRPGERHSRRGVQSVFELTEGAAHYRDGALEDTDGQ